MDSREKHSALAKATDPAYHNSQDFLWELYCLAHPVFSLLLCGPVSCGTQHAGSAFGKEGRTLVGYET